MRPIIRLSSLSRIRWALRNNQERYSSTFYSKSRKLLIGVNQNQALLNTNTDNSSLYSRSSIFRGLSAEAVEAADPATTRVTVSGFVSLCKEILSISEFVFIGLLIFVEWWQMWIEQVLLLSMREESVMVNSWLVISAKYDKNNSHSFLLHWSFWAIRLNVIRVTCGLRLCLKCCRLVHWESFRDYMMSLWIQ